MRDIFLRSGKWRWSLEDASAVHGRTLELIEPGDPRNKMAVPLPAGAAESLSSRDVAEIAREPQVRLWIDEHDILWRVARVGPDTYYPYPVSSPHLVFDSEHAFAGIVELDPHARLGDLTDDELRTYRDGMRDFGGRRRGFRLPPGRRSA